MTERAIDPRISAEIHFHEASKKLSEVAPVVAAFVTSPVALTALAFPLYELYLAGKSEIASLRDKQSSKR